MGVLYDLAIIGAGLSGLSAASTFHTLLPSSRVLILEAKDRVGGKTLSVSTTGADGGRGGTVDLGAAWINDTNQSAIYAVAKRFKVELLGQRGEGADLHWGAGEGEEGEGGGKRGGRGVKKVGFGEGVFSPEEAEQVATFVKHVDATGAKLQALSPAELRDLDGITLQKYCEKHFPSKAVLATANRGCRGWLGIEASETSALFFIDYVHRGGGVAILSSDLKDGAQYLRVRHGTQTFSKKLAESLPPGSILLSHAVSSIVQANDGICTVHSKATGFTATSRKVIVSVPSPLYRHISFSPPLPAEKATFVQSTSLGYYAKMILIYDRPWWREAGLSGRLNASAGGPFAFTRDTCAEMDGQFSLTCFVVGEEGRKWSKLSADQRKRQVIDQVSVFAAGYDAPEPIQILEKEWVKEPWSEGAPNPVPDLGAFAEGGGGVEALKKPFGSIHFVGTETADVWRGYMDGAVRSGERGATEVLEALAKDTKRGYIH